MRLVSESKLFKLFIKQGIEFDLAHLLAMEAVMLLMEDESLEVDSIISQLIKRELVKTV
jgi:hypothetical protein